MNQEAPPAREQNIPTYQQNRHATTKQLRLKTAENGDVNAMFNLDALYAKAIGTQPDHQKAIT